MRFGLFGGAAAPRLPDVAASAEGFFDFVETNVEAEALGFHSSFVTEHHFTGIGQLSAPLTLLTYIAARTTRLRLGTAILVLPWHNPVLLAEQVATLDLLSRGGLISASAKATATTSSRASPCRPTRPSRASRKYSMCWCARSPPTLRFPTAAASSASTRWLSSRRRTSGRTRRCGWRPAAKPRSRLAHGAASISCSTSSRRRSRLASASRSTGASSRRRATRSIRCGSPLPAISSSRAMPRRNDEALRRQVAIHERLLSLSRGSESRAGSHILGYTETLERDASLIGPAGEITDKLAALEEMGVAYVLLFSQARDQPPAVCREGDAEVRCVTHVPLPR